MTKKTTLQICNLAIQYIDKRHLDGYDPITSPPWYENNYYYHNHSISEELRNNEQKAGMVFEMLNIFKANQRLSVFTWRSFMNFERQNNTKLIWT